MSFHNVRLPADIERGAQGGPGFLTTIFELSSGAEIRNQNYSRPKSFWDLGYGVRSKADQQEIYDFFMVREGMTYGFRFKDWADYEIGTDSTDTEQEIGTGDAAETQFQIVRRYTSGGVTYSRPVTRIVSGTLRVFVDGVEQTITTHYTADEDTGVITFVAAPGSGLSVGVICEFDIPVRFNVDEFPAALVTGDAYGIPGLPIKELRETLVTI